MHPIELIDKYYCDYPEARRILIAHSHQVAGLAVAVAEHVMQSEPVDKGFVAQSAMLHDIGMLYTDTPKLGCYGDQPYITHGIIGAELLVKENLPIHALVCERHIGVGLRAAEIVAQHLPLPVRDMIPETLEEIIITYADLFFSKGEAELTREKDIDRVRQSLARFGAGHLAIFEDWHARFAG
jgi:uncharacterized protein